jgi:hypothetical protein
VHTTRVRGRVSVGVSVGSGSVAASVTDEVGTSGVFAAVGVCELHPEINRLVRTRKMRRGSFDKYMQTLSDIYYNLFQFQKFMDAPYQATIHSRNSILSLYSCKFTLAGIDCTIIHYWMNVAAHK